MFKKMLLSLAPMLLVATMVTADDDLLREFGGLNASSIQDATITIESFDLDGLDVEGLAGKSGDSDEAIEACFRRVGFGGYHCGWGGYYGCYRPLYTCYRPIYYYRPVTYCYPVHYWGCY